MALRASSRPEGAGIVAQRMPDVAWSIYCSHAYAADQGVPDCRDAICMDEILGFEGWLTGLPAWQWLLSVAPEADIHFRSNSFVSLLSNLKAGLGIGPLPVIIGDAEPELLRCFPPPPELNDEMWLIVREELKAQPHVRALVDFLANYVRREFAVSS